MTSAPKCRAICTAADADAAGGADDQDLVARLDAGLVAQEGQGGGAAEGQGGGLFEGEVGRLERDQPVLGHRAVFGVAAEAAAGKGEDLVAR